MRAQAPGKLVLSGAYAVLEGTRAIVVAVDRYVVADSERSAEFVTPEVREALPSGDAPWFDASGLRVDGRKLGLGSSAAILVASLGALELAAQPKLEESELRARVFPRALAAHRRAQRGGSGVDVASSTYGGTLVVKPVGETLELTPVELPSDLKFWALASGVPASTPELIRHVHALRAANPGQYETLMQAQALASERAADALANRDARTLLDALAEQGAALAALGAAAGVPIVTPELLGLQHIAQRAGAAVLPAGAGGGDVSWWVSRDAPPPTQPGLEPLALGFRAKGLCACPANP
ncbi:MAG: mevalonate kinase family protein [Myxococcota bacterium]